MSDVCVTLETAGMTPEKIPTAPPMNPRPRKQLDTKTYEGRFAERLKTLRIKAKLTHEDVAEALGVTVFSIYNWESGRHFPSISLFPQLAELYKLKRGRDILPAE